MWGKKFKLYWKKGYHVSGHLLKLVKNALLKLQTSRRFWISYRLLHWFRKLSCTSVSDNNYFSCVIHQRFFVKIYFILNIFGKVSIMVLNLFLVAILLWIQTIFRCLLKKKKQNITVKKCIILNEIKKKKKCIVKINNINKI